MVPHYATIPTWCALSGVKRSATYALIAEGKIKACKLGKRTLIDVKAGLAFLETLPAAEIAAPSRRAAA